MFEKPDYKIVLFPTWLYQIFCDNFNPYKGFGRINLFKSEIGYNRKNIFWLS